MAQYTIRCVDWWWVKSKCYSLEVLRNARIALLGEDARVLDSRVPSCRHVSYYRLWLLLRSIRVVVTIGSRLVVALVVVVVVLGIAHGHAGILAGIVGTIGCRV